jgi:hypothetical protein
MTDDQHCRLDGIDGREGLGGWRGLSGLPLDFTRPAHSWLEDRHGPKM